MLIIDRFEGNMAVIEYKGKTFDIPRSLLPEGAKEGDVLKLNIKIDKEETEKRKNAAENLVEDLFE